nr:hypothetical protein Iba_chr03aCG3030 [Ipomoea batatas]
MLANYVFLGMLLAKYDMKYPKRSTKVEMDPSAPVGVLVTHFTSQSFAGVHPSACIIAPLCYSGSLVVGHESPRSAPLVSLSLAVTERGALGLEVYATDSSHHSSAASYEDLHAQQLEEEQQSIAFNEYEHELRSIFKPR